MCPFAKTYLSHGQLYGIVSRIISRRGMKTLAHDENGEPTLQTGNMNVQRGPRLCLDDICQYMYIFIA
jgi:hypothetical protein